MSTFHHIFNTSHSDATYHLKKKKRTNLLVLLNANLAEQDDWLDSANAFSPFVSWFENGLKSYIQIPGKYLPKNQEFETGSIFNSITYTPFKRHYEPISVLNKTKSFYTALAILKKKIYFRRILKKKLNFIRIRKPRLKKRRRRRRNRHKKKTGIRQKYILSGFCRYKKKYKKDYDLRKLKKYNVKHIYIYDKYFSKRGKKKKKAEDFILKPKSNRYLQKPQKYTNQLSIRNTQKDRPKYTHKYTQKYIQKDTQKYKFKKKPKKFFNRRKKKQYKIRNKKLFFIQRLKRRIGAILKYNHLNAVITFRTSILTSLL